MNSPEIYKPSVENNSEIQDTAGERLKELNEKLEKKSENKENQGEKLDSARKETDAVFSKESGKEQRNGGEPTNPTIVTHATKKQRQTSYDNTMKQIRSEMSTPARTFSKVIHSPVAEKTSDFIGATVARPNAILSGSVFALFATLGIYVTAKYYGYPLSGFETISAFILGWVVGVIYDYLQLMIRGGKNS